MELAWILVAGSVAIMFILANLAIRYRSLYLNERFSKTSYLVKHGKTMEHFTPWLKDFPGDPRRFRFIGDPIDGVLFGEDEITFMEFKSGKSRLSEIQQRVKRLIQEGKVKWKEIRT